MALIDDVTLIGKKIVVTVVIYLLPVTILVGGLLLTRYLLDDTKQPANESASTTSLLKH